MTSRRALAGALVLAGLLALAGVVFAQGLGAAANYDEGVYLASLDALRHGQALGSDVYASQAPGFYVLLQALSLLPGDGVDGIRVAFLLVALGGLLAAYGIGRRLAGPWGGLGAAALVAVTAPYPVQAARVQADTASVALALAAVAVACYAERRSRRWAVAGGLAAAAISVKLLALSVVAPLAVLFVAHRSWRAAGALAAGASAVWAVLLVAYAGALGELWESVVSDHRDARGLGPSYGDNLERVLLHPLDWRTPAGVLVPIGLVCAVVVLRRLELLALGTWIAASALLLIVQQPLLDHHFVLLAATLAVPAGAGLGAAVALVPSPARYAAAGVAALALVAGFLQEQDRLADQKAERADVLAAADLLREGEQDELVATDLPIVAYLGDRRVPGRLVDTSFVRLKTGSLTVAEFLEELSRLDVREVVIGRELDRLRVLRELAERYATRLEEGNITIFLAP